MLDSELAAVSWPSLLPSLRLLQWPIRRGLRRRHWREVGTVANQCSEIETISQGSLFSDLTQLDLLDSAVRVSLSYGESHWFKSNS
ncbi:hypothetical protein Lal_00041090, partial [Lupinus albus]